MKLYNENGACCNADKDQIPQMLKSGWLKKAPVPVKELDTDTSSESVAEPAKSEADASPEVKEAEEEAVEKVKAPAKKVANRISKSSTKKIIPKK